MGWEELHFKCNSIYLIRFSRALRTFNSFNPSVSLHNLSNQMQKFEKAFFFFFSNEAFINI